MRLKEEEEEEEKVKKFGEKFGTFFEEFKEDGLKMWMFYVFYVLRRIALVLSFHFISDGILQLTIAIGFSIVVMNRQIPVYIMCFRVFKDNLSNIYQFLNELLIASYQIVILVGFANGIQGSSKTLANLCLDFITAAWVMNMAVSIITTTRTVYEKIRNFIRKQRAKRAERAYRLKTIPEIERKEEKTIEIE